MKYVVVKKILDGEEYADFRKVTDKEWRSLIERYKGTETTMEVYTKPGWDALQYDDWRSDQCVCVGPLKCNDARCELLAVYDGWHKRFKCGSE